MWAVWHLSDHSTPLRRFWDELEEGAVELLTGVSS